MNIIDELNKIDKFFKELISEEFDDMLIRNGHVDKRYDNSIENEKYKFEGLNEDNKGFEIKCLGCGSTNVEIKENYEYNWDEELEFDRVIIVCNDCGLEE